MRIREQIQIRRVQDGDNDDKLIITTGNKMLDSTKYESIEEAEKQLEGINWDIVVNLCAVVIEMLNDKNQ